MENNYFKIYANLSDEEIQNRNLEKENELNLISEEVSLKTDSETIKVAILGCPDKRFVKFYQEIFEKIFKKKSEVFIFDIFIDQLEGEKNVFECDCTEAVPYGPYDITYSHVLLKFIETEKQFKLIMNSHDVLRSGGIAIHVLDKEDYSDAKVEAGYFSVPLGDWKNKLKEREISFQEIPIKYGVAIIISKS